jgi:hypothetical protein
MDGLSAIKDFFGGLSSVERDTFNEVLNGMMESASQEATQPLRRTIHQLRVEDERESRLRDGLHEQLQSIQSCIELITRRAKGGEPTMLLFLALFRNVSADLHSRLADLETSERRARKRKLQAAMSSLSTRAMAADMAAKILLPENVRVVSPVSTPAASA